MTVLITGETGFLGSHLLKALIEFTSENIVVLKRSFSNLKRIEEMKENPRVKFYDVDKVDVEEAFKNNNIETIIHCATNYGRGDESCHNILDTNLMFPIKLLDLSVKWGTKTFINTDSFFNKENFFLFIPFELFSFKKEPSFVAEIFFSQNKSG